LTNQRTWVPITQITWNDQMDIDNVNNRLPGDRN